MLFTWCIINDRLGYRVLTLRLQIKSINKLKLRKIILSIKIPDVYTLVFSCICRLCVRKGWISSGEERWVDLHRSTEKRSRRPEVLGSTRAVTFGLTMHDYTLAAAGTPYTQVTPTTTIPVPDLNKNNNFYTSNLYFNI